MDGFGKKSYDNLISAIKRASHTTLPRLVYSLGIPGIGLAGAKLICRKFQYDFDKMRRASAQELTAIDGIGAVLAEGWMEYFQNEKNNQAVDGLLEELTFESEEEPEGEAIFEGMSFVVTGSAHHFANRKELQKVIEARGGKVTGSVTSKTAYLINNDTQSASSKNKKARELGIPVISEEDFIKMLGEESNAD